MARDAETASSSRRGLRHGFTPRPHRGAAPARPSGWLACWLAGWLAEAAHREGLGHFTPNEASYQRYVPGGNGLPPHRDQRYYAFWIAIVTLTGATTFAIHASRALDDVVTLWTTQPDQVILLRGWRPDIGTDPRPYHRVDPPLHEPV